MKKLILIALVMSAITGFAVYYYANKLESKFDVQTVPVLVATKAIPKNTLISDEMVIIKKMPSDIVNSLSVKSFEEIKGRIAKESIEANEQVLTTKLNSLDMKDNSLSYLVKNGYRAMTVKTDEIIGVGNYIKKGDFVDVAAILISSGEIKQIVSEIVLENVEVLEVGKNSENIDEKEKEENTSVTISVLASDVAKLHYALSEGKCRLILRSVVDKTIVNPAPYLH